MIGSDIGSHDRPRFHTEQVHQYHGVRDFQGPGIYQSINDFRQVLKTSDARPLPPMAQISGAPARRDGVAVERAYRRSHHQIRFEAGSKRTPRARLPSAKHAAAGKNQCRFRRQPLQ